MFVPAMKRLEAVLTNELKGVVNSGKTNIAGTDAAAVAMVRHHAGLPVVHASTPFRRNLGVDYAPLRPRRALKRGSVMANRLKITRTKTDQGQEAAGHGGETPYAVSLVHEPPAINGRWG